MTDDKHRAAEDYARHTPGNDEHKAFLAGADWAMEKMSNDNKLFIGLDQYRLLQARCERYEKALKSIGRNAEELNKITNFDTLNAIIDTTKNALTEKWDAEEMMKKVSK